MQIGENVVLIINLVQIDLLFCLSDKVQKTRLQLNLLQGLQRKLLLQLHQNLLQGLQGNLLQQPQHNLLWGLQQNLQQGLQWDLLQRLQQNLLQVLHQKMLLWLLRNLLQGLPQNLLQGLQPNLLRVQRSRGFSRAALGAQVKPILGAPASPALEETTSVGPREPAPESFDLSCLLLIWLSLWVGDCGFLWVHLE